MFPLVGGLVVEIGGQPSHGAIVAHEYGVPVVINARDVMQSIQEGQTLTVDDTAGRIFLEIEKDNDEQ